MKIICNRDFFKITFFLYLRLIFIFTGHVNLKLSEKLKSILDLQATDINVTENIPFIPLEQKSSPPKVVGVITEKENIKDDHFLPKDIKIPKSKIKASTTLGTISVSVQNWFQTLQLSMLEKTTQSKNTDGN